jgi:cyclophilin family peptidyl-prolyl cis-trans isomerase
MRPILLVLCLAAPQDRPPASEERVILRTNVGDLSLALFPQAAPRHVEQFLRLVRAGVYDSTAVARIEPSFVVQFSGHGERTEPLTPEQRKVVARIPLEAGPIKHAYGILSMARETADPDSAESSFSILLGPAPHLDGKYTVFGRLERGEDVLDLIAKTKRREGVRPRFPVRVEKAEVAASEKAALEAGLRGAFVPPEGLARERIVLRTSAGDLVLALYPDVAPRHVEQILRLARAGVYTTSEFNHLEPERFVQLSRRRSLAAGARQTLRKLAAEFSRLTHRRGALSMARLEADPDSAESSFCLMIGDAGYLDGKYTIFGHVEAGLEVLDLIARLKQERPELRVQVDRAEVIVSPESIEAAAIRGPILPPPARAPLSPTLLVLGWALLLAGGIAVLALPARLMPPRLRCASLAIVLVLSFCFFVAAASRRVTGGGSAATGIAIFVGLVILFRLMSFFESPARRP